MPRNELDYFLNRVHQAYVDARKPLCADELCELTIERGRSRTISGIAEDYFAELLYKEIGKGYLHFFVDQPLVGGTHKVYPDVIAARALVRQRTNTLKSSICWILKWMSVIIVISP